MEKIKTLEALALKIAEQNEAFNLMTNEEKIVTIANDCLARIELSQIQAQTGVIFGWDKSKQKNYESIQTVCNTDSKFNCTACMKGGLLLSYVGRVNQYNFGQISDSNDIRNREHKKLTEIFTKEQLALIEFAFEGRLYITVKFDKETILKVVNFFVANGGVYSGFFTDNIEKMIEHYNPKEFTPSRWNSRNAEKRMVLICENIIKNKGVFIP